MEKTGKVKKNKIYTEEVYKTCLIAIDVYSDSEFSAKFYNSFSGTGQASSFHELIKKLDLLMDEIGCPMSGMKRRSFKKTETGIEHSEEMKTHENVVLRGKKATFVLKVLYRNNASWQGSVKWIEENREEHFRSVLELLWLIDSAVK